MTNYLKEHWVLIIGAATAALTCFYIGYFDEIGFAFIGFINITDVFYNLTGVFIFVALSISVAQLLSLPILVSRNKKAAFLFLIFSPTIIIGMVAYFAAIYLESPLLAKIAWVFIGLFFALSCSWNTFDRWPLSKKSDYYLLFCAIFTWGLFSYYSGGLYAHLQFNFGTPYEIKTNNKTLTQVRVLRSSENGLVYYLDGKVSFIPLDSLISLQRNKKIDFPVGKNKKN